MRLRVEIASVELLESEGRCRAFIAARILPPGILLQHFRIMESVDGKLYFASPYYKRNDVRFLFIVLPRELHEELKDAAFKAYFAAGGAQERVARDLLFNSEHRR